MTKAPKYTVTAESVSVVWEGKTHTVRKGATNFLALRGALLAEDWDAVPRNLTPAKSVESWSRGAFKVVGEDVLYRGAPLPRELGARAREMAAAGEDPTPLFKFWERLQSNPSMRSVQQLWPFLAHAGIPLTPDGKFLAYKGVTEELKDVHTGQFDNSPGKVHEMPRNQISDDPQQPCHEGFHVGAREYARSFGPRVVVVEVDPADVVCVPYDSSWQKMRVCRYRVVGHMAPDGKLSGTVERDGGEAPELSKELLARFDDMDARGLMKETLAELRDYARWGLGIVGASSIPGGKVALVAAVAKHRRRKKK